ncbi:MAG: hypothetical protein KA105_02815 [Caulobacter sp.]|nr:hypothetical protein [Caulobacter sp.]
MMLLCLEGRAIYEQRQQDRTGWLAWHTGLLTARATNNPKRFPKLTDIIGGKKLRRNKATKPASWQHLLSAAMAWNAAVNKSPKKTPKAKKNEEGSDG